MFFSSRKKTNREPLFYAFRSIAVWMLPLREKPVEFLYPTNIGVVLRQSPIASTVLA